MNSSTTRGPKGWEWTSQDLLERGSTNNYEKKKGFLEHLYLEIDKRGFINTYEIKTS
jgi:hypothetical protein